MNLNGFPDSPDADVFKIRLERPLDSPGWSSEPVAACSVSAQKSAPQA
jgi:hypothetical protein